MTDSVCYRKSWRNFVNENVRSKERLGEQHQSLHNYDQSLNFLCVDFCGFFSALCIWIFSWSISFCFGRDRESDRESRIRERREEQDKKKEEQKMIKKAARERQRIEQGKKGWWKDFNWCIGVMVEMEWDDEWWDAIVIQVLPAKAQHANNAEEDSVLQGEPAAPISHAREAGLDVPCPALSDGVEVGNKRTACKESIESQDGASQKAEEAEGWEAALGYMVKKCQVTIDWHDLGVILKPVSVLFMHASI
jgi:hypothetical protein